MPISSLNLPDGVHAQFIGQRRGQRVDCDLMVRVVREGTLVACGRLLDISKSGAAFRSDIRLQVGQQYVLAAESGAMIRIRIVRNFDCICYGAEFMAPEDQGYRFFTKCTEYQPFF